MSPYRWFQCKILGNHVWYVQSPENIRVQRYSQSAFDVSLTLEAVGGNVLCMYRTTRKPWTIAEVAK